MYVHITQAVISYSKLTCDCNCHMRCAHVREKTEYNKRIKTQSFWAPESESASTSKCMTPTLGIRPVSSVGLATNWRLLTVDNQTHPDSSFDRQKFLYGRLSMCFSSCIFHSCIFHSRIFSAPASSNAGSKQPSASSRILYCGHSTPYRRLVCEVERCTAHSPCRVTWACRATSCQLLRSHTVKSWRRLNEPSAMDDVTIWYVALTAKVDRRREI